MAIRLDKSVVCGEIDSTEKGTVRCVLWLVGRPEPLVVTLDGDPWRDIAGTKVIFENGDPTEEEDVALLDSEQFGTVGDITASRKVKHLLISEEEMESYYDSNKPMPFEWRNSLYLEWFSTKNGRVLIESSGYVIRVGDPVWTLDEADEQAQKLSNQQAMRNFLNSIIRRQEGTQEGSEDESEEAWERRLEASDRLTDAHLEALEKYEGDPEEEDKTSFVMGWDHLLEGGDTEETPRPWLNDIEDPVSAEEGEEWKMGTASVNDNADSADGQPELPSKHPLLVRTSALAVSVMHFANLGDENERAEQPSSALDSFVRLCLQISGKCAGTLSDYYSSQPMPRGMILATLKRCLKWADDALIELKQLESEVAWHPHRPLMGELRTEIGEIREDILSLRAELGGS